MNILYFLAGVDTKLIKKASVKEKNGYLVLGLCMLIPASMGVYGMYLQSKWLGYDHTGRILLSIVWGLFILIIDILIVYTLKRPKSLFNSDNIKESIIYLLKIFARLGISILIGFVISIPIILKNYEPEVNTELVYIKNEKRDSLKRRNNNNIKQLTLNDSLVLKNLRKSKKCLDVLITAERNGSGTVLICGEASKTPGTEQRYRDLIFRRNEIKKEIDYTKKVIQDIIKEETESIQILLNKVEENHQQGFAIRQQALDNIISKDKSRNIYFRYLIFTSLLIFLDSLAMLMKIFMPLGTHDKKIIELENSEDVLREERNLKYFAIKIKTEIQKKVMNQIKNKKNGNLDKIAEDTQESIKSLESILGYDLNINKETLPDGGISGSTFNPHKEAIHYVETFIGFVFFMLIIYLIQSDNLEWFTKYGSLITFIYSLLMPYFKKIKIG